MTATATRKMTVTRKGEVIAFECDLSDAKILEILQNQRSSFAQDLAAKFSKLSEKQYAWACFLAVDSIARAAEFETQAYNFGPIVDAIINAQMRGLKRIKLRLGRFIIKPSRIAGRVYVMDNENHVEGNFGFGPEYLGWVESTKTTIRNQEFIEALQVIAQDVTGAAKLYGQETGNCSCCGRELTVKESIERGIGPICAEKFGL